MFDEIKKEKKIICNIDKIISTNGFNTRADECNENEPYFKSSIKPKNISKDRISINHFIKINGNLEVIKFMNDLFDEINNEFKDKCDIEASKDSLELEVIFYGEKEEKIKDCLIDIELFKYEEDQYLLEFLRTGGDLQEYYHYFLEIKKIIEKII